ncbi:PREDICTED: mediator of RNA polymerase II transcription subunit 16 isoform X2 [Nelumbo nucifera]|uniref:Mediator of RNA polymerase II transcription subunit 16 isoform X2 n=1 Tax=Nelumbo nucifera TaxID=4432 RepID=A0A1U7YVS3_NELNU|nr:PREDICTED: mediator of RNA polymerase II transcription subunit 16 isoform X2 [Nelumbo nucifera]
MNSASVVKDSEEGAVSDTTVLEASRASDRAEAADNVEEEAVDKRDDPMEEDSASPPTVFRIRLKQPNSNLRHKMSVPELCRNFSSVSWCGKLNIIACASETCARIPSSNANPPFWIPIHIVNPERPTECAVFNVIADSPRDSVQFIEWSPASCPRALLIANFHGRITIWTQPSQGPVNLVRDGSCWQCEYEWRQDIAVVTKWLSGMSPYRWVSSNSSSSANSKSAFEEKFLSQQPQTSARWPNFLCVCSVFSSGSVQLHWSQWPPNQTGAASKWFSTSKGLLGAGPSGIMAADAIITEAGTMHVAGVPIVNPSTVVVWEVTPGPGNGIQATPKTTTTNGVPPSVNPPSWAGFAPLAAYLFSWQEYLGSEGTLKDTVSLHCSPVSNFSAYVSPEAASQSSATTTWGSGVTAVAFDPTRGGSVITVVIVEVSLNSVIAVLDADFHSLPSTQHRQQHGPSLDRIKCRLLEGTNAQEVRALVLDMQARLLLDMLGKGIESALINPANLVSEPWQASGEMLSGIDPDAMTVEPALVSSIQAYVDAVLDLASHFITRLRRYASFCRTLASHAVGATSSTGSNRNMVTSPTHSSASSVTSQGGQSGTSSTGNSQMQAWMQGAIAKISSSSDGVSYSTPNPMSGPAPFMPISINTGTFPGTPAVRLIGDCHFLHRLCQLLLFCFFFRRKQMPRYIGGAQRNTDSNMQKPQPVAPGKVEEVNSVPARPAPGMTRSEDVQGARTGQPVSGAKGVEEGPVSRSVRVGSGNAGQGYTFDEVKVLFLILMDLCRRTAGLAHPLPVSQVGGSNIQIRLHYIDGNYTVLPEVVEASLGPHMQNMPRPRGADAAGLLLRELELHPPAEEWHRRNMFGGPWSDPEGAIDDNSKLSNSFGPFEFNSSEDYNSYYGDLGLWPRKRRMSERDAAFGLKTSVGLGAYFGIMGSRRDVVTAVWKTGLEGVWYKCIRCLRQTSAFASPGSASPNQNDREAWWISRWCYGCPMCGGTWVRVV